MAIDFNELRELLATIATTDIAELTLKSADFELTVRKGIPLMPTASPTTGATVAAPTPVPIDKKWVDIKSPMVGTFYRSPGPDDPPFVEVGDRIRARQTVCIIEAMKLMNEIEAEVSGQVMEILVKNGEPVEYDQPLMRINPD